uniref:SCAN box domain-containing protein n=1 Tax=Oryzias latipes TaxID=8090 RepID=A0A3P9IDZ3_ORYLA
MCRSVLGQDTEPHIASGGRLAPGVDPGGLVGASGLARGPERNTTASRSVSMTSGGPRGQQGRTAGARGRPEAGRARRPIPLPRMRALEACAELDKGWTDVYRAVRGALRERRHNSPVTCCRRLRSAEVPSGRRPAGACCRLKGLCRGWDRPERRTEELIVGVAVMEQLGFIQRAAMRRERSTDL